MISSKLAWVPGWSVPVLLAVFFSLDCYAELRPVGTVGGFLLTLLVSGMFALLMYGASRVMLRQAGKAALLSFVVLGTTFFFSYLHLQWRQLPRMHDSSARYFLIGILVLWVATHFVLRRIRSNGATATRGLFVVLALLSLLAFGRACSRLPTAVSSSVAGRIRLPAAPPDIYFILLDGHTSPESLQRYWGHDSSQFVRTLQAQGFYVVSNAAAIYDSTPSSTAGVLNMDYPVDPPREWTGFARNAWLVEQVANAQSKVLLEKAGYESIDLSVFPGRAGAPAFYRHSSVVAARVPGLAFMKTFVGYFAQYYWVRQQGQKSLAVLRQIERIAGMRGDKPRFVYAHLLLPHPPYFFGRNGEPVNKGLGANYLSATKEDYLDQLVYVDRLITNAVAAIVEASVRPPVIVIQGDHGYRLLQGDDRIPESLTILNAMRLPGGNASVTPYSGITPVNTFRLVFNRYFEAGLPYLPDRSRSVLEKAPEGL